MKKSLLFIFCIILGVASATALSVDDIRNSGDYYWGEGIHDDPSTADKIALEMLANHMSVNISSHTYMVNKSSSVRQQGGKEQKDEQSEYTSLIESYSSATIENSERMVLPQNAGKEHILRYVAKADVYKIFDSRRRKITEMVKNAQKQLELGKVDVALKDYYWAYALLRSLPNTSDEEFRGHLLCSYIPQQMADIVSNLSVGVMSQDGNDFELFFTHQGSPVSSLDYVIYENGYPGPLSNAGEGIGEVSFIGNDPVEKIEIEIEYKYKDQAVDPDMRTVLNGVSDYNVKGARRILSVNGKQLPATPVLPSAPKNSGGGNVAAGSGIAVNGQSPAQISMPDELDNDDIYRENIGLILSGISGKVRQSAISHLLTPNGVRKYQDIIKRGKIRVVSDSDLKFWTDPRGQIVCRGTVLTFQYRTGKYRSFTRDLVFTLTPDGLVDDITLGLGQQQRNQILGDVNIPDFIKHNLVGFIEEYQTAFAVGDIEYLKTIFDDNAIIITGTVVQQAAPKDQYLYRNNQKVIYNRSTKDQYLTKVKATFDSREYVNVRFNNINVAVIDPDNHVYGVQLEQDYFSPHYGDHGYLYLQLHMPDPTKPIIHVRTWQPSSVDIRQLFNQTDFPVYLTN